MKLKKVMALSLAGMMTLSAIGCGSTEQTSSGASTGTSTSTSTEASIESEDGKLVIWTLANDLIDFGRLRNAIIHGGNEDYIIAEPHIEIVEKIKASPSWCHLCSL